MWYVHWLEAPELAIGKDGQHWIATWTQVSNPRNSYDHNLMLAQSTDGGATWSAASSPHPTEIPAYYGLPAPLVLPEGGIQLNWLDGRNTKIRVPHSGRYYPKMNARTTLRSTVLTAAGEQQGDYETSARISALAPFEAQNTARGPVLAARLVNRQKFRDIHLLFWNGECWTDPVQVSDDGWQTSSFTLEGPAMDVRGEQVALGWYSAAKDAARIQLQLTDLTGTPVSKRLRLDRGKPLGKVDLVYDRVGKIRVSWLEQTEEGVQLLLATVTTTGKLEKIAELQTFAEAVPEMYPRMIRSKDGIFLGWIDPAGKIALQCLQ